MKQKVNTLIKNFGIILVLFLSFLAVRPLFAPGFFPMHDDTQVARVFEMGKALRDGMFPVRWVPDLGYGYGYPIFNFYAPLAYYVGGFFTLLGFDALIATKIMMGIGILLSGIFMYLLAREFWGELGGIVSGLFYVYAPYHALDIYVRGDVAEFWAYAFIPLVFYGLYKIYNDYKLYKKNRWKWVLVGSLGYSGVMLSHNLTALMVTPFLAIVILFYFYIAYKNKNIHTTYYLILATVLGLMLSAFYWIPALFEMKHANVLSQIGGGADFRDHFVCIQQLWNSGWGFGGSAPGCIDGLSFRIGKLHIISVLIALITTIAYYVFRHSGKRSASRISIVKRDSGGARMAGFEMDYRLLIFILSILGFVLSVFLKLEISRFIWEAIPQMAFFQYPWRFLLLVSFFSSLLLGATTWFLQSFSAIHLRGVASQHLEGGRRTPSRWILIGFFVIIIFLLINFNSKLFIPQTILPKTAEDYTNALAVKWFASKTSDEYMPRDFVKPNNQNEIPSAIIIPEDGHSKISYEILKTNNVSAIVNSSEDANFLINIAYFPAWKIFVDGKETSFELLNNRISLSVPLGQHKIDLKFQETLVERISNLVSLFGIVIIIVGIIKFRRRLVINE